MKMGLRAAGDAKTAEFVDDGCKISVLGQGRMKMSSLTSTPSSLRRRSQSLLASLNAAGETKSARSAYYMLTKVPDRKPHRS